MNILDFLYYLRDVLALLVAIALSLILMNSSEHPAANAFRYGVGEVISVVSFPFMLVPKTIDIWHENTDLRNEIIRLKDKQFLYRDAILENQRLRKLLDFRGRDSLNYMACEVIARDPSLNLTGLLLDKGKKEGIMPGMAVITADGLVGKIISSHDSFSEVQLATDRNFATSIRIERSRVDGILRWKNKISLIVSDVMKNLDVKTGDRIVTSGLGQVIPEGIPVGVVAGASRKQDEIFQSIDVKPYVSFARLEEVFVLIPEEKRIIKNEDKQKP